jgi:hypothetical protein
MTFKYCEMMQNSKLKFEIEPVTRMNWNMFVELFGEKGACGNCLSSTSRNRPTVRYYIDKQLKTINTKP